MSHSIPVIPYRLIAQSALYLSAGTLVFFGLIFLLAALGWEGGQSFLGLFLPAKGTTVAGRLLLFLCACFSCGVGAFALALPWLPRIAVDSVSIRTGGGEVTIPFHAIEDYLQREAQRIPGVNSLRIRLSREEGSLAFHLQVLITAQVTIPQLTEEIQSFIQREVRDVIGVKDIGGVHLTINRISNDTRPIALPVLSDRSNQERERRSGSSHS